MSEYDKAIAKWRRDNDRARKAELSANYRATEPGAETPAAIEAMDGLARMAEGRAEKS